ncbi:hypothetical protein FGG08_000778 [Glutinoglossum americanum]|uniref:BRCT domain-containing protein n=1 Tax=Glutinoglossum americanum TaxID=1670608 RepID=A0A9P8IET4_9PEZI|nr:hypothetical protein FGG08_000778 [Glutinoglossum americanum]
MGSLNYFVRQSVSDSSFRELEFKPGNAQVPLCYEINVNPDTNELELGKQITSAKKSRAQAILYAYAGNVFLEACVPNKVALASSCTADDELQFTYLQPMVMDKKVLIKMRPEDEISIGAVKFSIGFTKEPKVQVASSPVLGDEKIADLSTEHDKLDRTSIQVARSMCESTPLAGTRGSLSTPKTSVETQEKVLDTPVLESRHSASNNAPIKDSSLEDSLPPIASTKRRKGITTYKSSTSEQGDTSAARKRKPRSPEEPVSTKRLPKRSRTANVSDNAPLEEPSPAEGATNKGSRTARNVLYNGPVPRIVFSNSKVPEKPELMKFLRAAGAKRLNAVSENTSNFLCVGPGELKRTSKLTLSVALGKTIATDEWVVDSEQAGHLLDPAPYLPRDPTREQAWRFNLAEAIQRGRDKVKVLEGWSVYFTPSLSRDLGESIKELQQIALSAGASSVQTRLPLVAAEAFTNTVLLGNEGDKDASELTDLGWKLYSKDLLSLSILRGRLDMNSDEFKLSFQPTSQRTKSRVTRGR